MLFDYPSQRHERRHGPSGYETYQPYKDWLRDEFVFRCVYCLTRERWYPCGHTAFGVDHVMSKHKHPDLSCEYTNLVYSCNRCNSAKGQHELLDPCREGFGKHLRVHEDGTLESLSVAGRELVLRLGLNHPSRKEFRANKVMLVNYLSSRGAEAKELLVNLLGFPDDLPELPMKQPSGNSRPEGLENCYFMQCLEGSLPETY
jgi:hypothetical protein